MMNSTGFIQDVSRELGISSDALVSSSFFVLGLASIDAFRAAAIAETYGVRLDPTDLLAGLTLSQAFDRGQPCAVRLSVENTCTSAPLTHQQKVIYFQEALDGDPSRYLFHAVLTLEHAPRVLRLRKRLAEALEMHPILRSTYRWRGTRSTQTFHRGPVGPESVPLTEYDVAAEVSERELLDLVDANRPFDLSTEMPIRWALVRDARGGARLLHTEHHLVHDGMSFMNFVRSLDDAADRTRIDDAYFQYASTQTSPDRALVSAGAAALSQASRPVWSARQAQASDCDETDHQLRLTVPPVLMAACRRQAAQRGSTLFALFFAAFADVVSARFDGDAIALGTGMANRAPRDLDACGMFVSMAPIVIPREEACFADRLASCATALINAEKRSGVSLAEISKEMQGRDPGREPIEIAFSLFLQDLSSIELFGNRVPVDSGLFSGRAKFPLDCVLILHGSQGQDGGELLIEARRDKVTRAEMWLVWTRLVRRLQEISGLSAPELPATSLFPASLPSDRAAVLDAEGNGYTYGDLDRLSRAFLQRVPSGTVVGVHGEAGPTMVAAILAVARAGCTYVPLMANQPAARLKYMLDQAGVEVIVSSGGATDMPGVTIIDWAELERVAAELDQGMDPVVTSVPLYCLFTSGSTGKPRGVMVDRAAAAARADAYGRLTGLRADSRVMQWGDLGFDVSVIEIWGCVRAGGTLVVPPTATRVNPSLLKDFLSTQVDVGYVSASISHVLTTMPWDERPRLRVLTTGAEPLAPVTAVLPFEVLNMYGPTEITVFATADTVDQGSTRLPAIGPAIDGAEVILVSHDGRLVEGPGEGEIWVGGPFIARGYVNDETATASRFVPSPHDPSGAIFYRTGDMARRDPDGRYHFLGRMDRQVKVSGVRVELGEIEASALAVPGVALAAAGMERNVADQERLRLAVVLDRGVTQDAIDAGIRANLLPQLRHLRIEFHETLPTLSSGKVDVAGVWREHQR